MEEKIDSQQPNKEAAGEGGDPMVEHLQRLWGKRRGLRSFELNKK